MASRIQSLMQLLGSMSKADKKKFLKKMHEHREYDRGFAPDTRNLTYPGQSDHERFEELMDLITDSLSLSERDNYSKTMRKKAPKLQGILEDLVTPMSSQRINMNPRPPQGPPRMPPQIRF